ncbi:MAG: glycosyltransferase 87 family protein [Thermoplasmata archaeon]
MLGLRAGPAAAALILLLGLALREGFSFWTGHPYDFEIWIRTGYVVAHGTNPYLHPWPPVAGVSFGYTGQALPSAAYLPFWPDVFGSTYLLWERIGGGNRFFLYFLLKQGPIAGDVAVAGLLYRFVLRETRSAPAALGALAFWSFFPYDIVIGSIWGQLDPVTTALILAALLTSERQSAGRSLAWGLGIFLKWITVVFLPLELFRNRGFRRLWPLGSVALAGLLTLLAFLAAGWSFAGIFDTTTSVGSGGGGGMNYAQWFNIASLGAALGTEPLLGAFLTYLWIPGCILAGWYGSRWIATGAPGQPLRALLLVISVALLLRWGLNEQYMLYPFALLVADIYTYHPDRRRFLYFLVALSSGYLLTNNVLGIWFATPAFPQAFTFVQSFDDSGVGGTFRFDLLYLFSALVTITLIQLIWVVLRDQPAPWPWLLPRWPALRAPPGRPVRADPREG